MESAVGVLLYQMGVAAFAVFAFVGAIGWTAYTAWRRSGDYTILWLVVAVVVISANAVLQEEAYFSPLALGLALLLGGVGLGTLWNPRLNGTRRPG
jgi:4-amino-4-deoxy-L-arabinose transferase-like glycosyltransferase